MEAFEYSIICIDAHTLNKVTGINHQSHPCVTTKTPIPADDEPFIEKCARCHMLLLLHRTQTGTGTAQARTYLNTNDGVVVVVVSTPLDSTADRRHIETACERNIRAHVQRMRARSCVLRAHMHS